MVVTRRIYGHFFTNLLTIENRLKTVPALEESKHHDLLLKVTVRLKLKLPCKTSSRLDGKERQKGHQYVVMMCYLSNFQLFT